MNMLLTNIKSKAHKLLVGFALMLVLKNYGQTNLVPNGSFEQYTTCPQGLYHEHPDYWYQPDRGGGYWNACRVGLGSVPNTGYGYQDAKTGVAFVGMFYRNGGDNRNYFQVKLLDSLKFGKHYYAEYFVNRAAGEMRLACNNQSMLFTRQVTYIDTINMSYLPANPQITNYDNPIITDTVNWVKVSGIFTAQGGEQYLTLGNFKNNAQTPFIIIQPTGYAGAAYFVDDVAVYALDSFKLKADAGKDTTITIGDSVFIGSYTNGIDSLQWLQNGILKIDSTRPGFWVHPLVSTCYVLTQTVNGFTSSDTVCINVLPLPLNFINYSLRQAQGVNPSSLLGTKQSVENIWQTANEINVSHFNILRSIDGINFKIIGSVKAQNKSLNNYSFIHENVNEGLNYNKIGSIDFDGKMSFSEVRTINLKPQTLNSISIYPNPAKEKVVITCNNAKELMIIDYLGRVVYSDKMHRESYNINIQSFSNGLYLVKLITNDNLEKVEKLIKQ